MKWTIPFVVKAVLSIIVVPLGFLFMVVWPWWEKRPWDAKKIITGFFIVPFWAFMFVVGKWWDGLPV